MVESKLGIKGSEQTYKNMTSRDLKTAGEMFLYLYSCSGFTNSNFQATENGKWFKTLNFTANSLKSCEFFSIEMEFPGRKIC